MQFWNAVKIENCAAQQVHSQGLCFMWIHVKTTFEHQRALDLKLFLKTFWLTRYVQVDLKNFLASGAFFLERVATDRAMILQEINSRHSSFLTVNQETTQVCRPAGRPGQYFQSPEATFSAVRAQPWVFVLIYAVRLTFPSFADAVSFFCLCKSQPDLQVIRSCSQ